MYVKTNAKLSNVVLIYLNTTQEQYKIRIKQEQCNQSHFSF